MSAISIKHIVLIEHPLMPQHCLFVPSVHTERNFLTPIPIRLNAFLCFFGLLDAKFCYNSSSFVLAHKESLEV